MFVRRIDVFHETVAATKGLVVPATEKWVLGQTVDPIKRYAHTSVRVVDADCIETAKGMLDAGRRPVVLNLSDDLFAGGCVLTGSGAQEESLWRRTALCQTQNQSFYPLCHPAASLLYSPQVPVVRETEAKDYAWLAAPFALDFIACPALKFPNKIKDAAGQTDLMDADKATLRDRLRLILRVAANKGNDAVVLGAMGCGAWRNPALPVAKIFAEVLPEFAGCFHEIAVAILTTRSSPTLATVFADVLAPLNTAA